jgi:plasmid stabilization system protein ParE
VGDFRTDVGRIASKVSMATIIWEDTAKLQLAENITYAMMEFGKTTAIRWEKDVRAVEWRLERYPTSYPPEPTLQDRPHLYRHCHLMHRRFKLIYFFDESNDIVRVMDIWDTRMNPEALIKRIK